MLICLRMRGSSTLTFIPAEGRAGRLQEQMKVTCNSHVETIGTMANVRLVMFIK